MNDFDDTDKATKRDKLSPPILMDDRPAGSSQRQKASSAEKTADPLPGPTNPVAPQDLWLEVGFRLRLRDDQIELLRFKLTACCFLYAIAVDLPKTGQTGRGPYDDQKARNGQSSRSLDPAASSDISIDDISPAIWERTLTGMRSGWQDDRSFWHFARYLAGLPRHTPVQDDTRLVRLCALRIAARSASNRTAIAALVDLIGLLAEIMCDEPETMAHKRLARRLTREALSELAHRVGLVIERRSVLPLWTRAASIWLQEIDQARKEGLLPADAIADDLEIVLVDEKAKGAFAQPEKPLQPPADRILPEAEEGCHLEPTGDLPAKPSLQVLKALNLTAISEPTKQEYAKQYLPLTHPLPLTQLPAAADVTAELSDLRVRMPNFGPVIQALLTDFALARRGQGIPILRLRPMLLVGPPGVGKTRFAKELAEVLGAAWSYLSTAGDSDNRRFAGTAAGYSTAHPAWPVDQIHLLQHANPILILDEIDKVAGGGTNGVVTHSILPLLEAQSAKQFSDPFLGGPIDLSAISWIFLANTTEGLSGPLLSRLTKFMIEPPGLAVFEAIVKTVITDVAKDRHIDPDELPRLPATFLADLKVSYARTRDIRRLKSAIEKALGLLVHFDDGHFGETIH
jgi:hypothetical protein